MNTSLSKVALTCLCLLTGVSSAQTPPTHTFKQLVKDLRITQNSAPSTSKGILTISSSNFSFENTPVGSTSSSQSLMLSNTGTADLNLTSLTTNLTAFNALNLCPTLLKPQQNCLVTLSFNPSKAEYLEGLLTAQSSENTVQALLTGAGIGSSGDLVANNSNIFGPVVVGSTYSNSYSYTNTGSLLLSGVSPSISGAGFSLKSHTCGSSLGLGESCDLIVEYTAIQPGTFTGSVSVLSSAQSGVSSQSLSASVNSSQDAVFELSKNTLNFYSALNTPSAAQYVRVQNTGQEPLTAVTVSGSANGFSVGHNCPETLTAGQYCDISTIYTPQSTEEKTSAIVISSTTSTQQVSLFGVSSASITPTVSGSLHETSPVNTTFNAEVGESVIKSIYIRSAGSTGRLITNVTITGTNASDFSIVEAKKYRVSYAGTFWAATASCGASFAAQEVTGCMTDVLSSTAYDVKKHERFKIKFSPLEASAKTASLNIFHNGQGPNPIVLPLTGSATGVTSVSTSTDTVAMGAVLTGSSINKAVSLLNDGTLPVTITNAQVTQKGTAGINVTSQGACTTMAANQTCDYSLEFSPVDTSAINAIFTITTSAGTKTVSVTGSGLVRSATISPSSETDFGSLTIAQTLSKDFTISNTGNTPVDVSSASVSGSEFRIANNPCVTVSAGSSCTISVEFSPTSLGAKSGSLTVSTNSNSPLNPVSLTGTGVAGGAVILNPGGFRSWADSSVAKSCYDYRYPSAPYAYTGNTGNGLYRIQPTGQSATDVYCDMTVDGGGWTLVLGGAQAVDATYASTTGATGVYPSSGATPSYRFKLADAFINATMSSSSATGAKYRFNIDFEGTTAYKRFVGTKTYSHLACGASAAVTSYSTITLDAGAKPGSGAFSNICGINDYVYTSDNKFYFVTNGKATNSWNGLFAGNNSRRASAPSSVMMWVR